MREHMGLFRGKRIDNGEWIEGSLLTLPDGRCFIVNNIFGACIDAEGNFINTEAPFVCEVDPDAVGECTGLRDKNGKLIFEGDIVNIHVPNGFDMTGVVEYYDYGFEVRDEENGAYECLWYPPSVISILGNIHDNPELLKGGEGE